MGNFDNSIRVFSPVKPIKGFWFNIYHFQRIFHSCEMQVSIVSVTGVWKVKQIEISGSLTGAFLAPFFLGICRHFYKCHKAPLHLKMQNTFENPA